MWEWTTGSGSGGFPDQWKTRCGYSNLSTKRLLLRFAWACCPGTCWCTVWLLYVFSRVGKYLFCYITWVTFDQFLNIWVAILPNTWVISRMITFWFYLNKNNLKYRYPCNCWVLCSPLILRARYQQWAGQFECKARQSIMNYHYSQAMFINLDLHCLVKAFLPLSLFTCHIMTKNSFFELYDGPKSSDNKIIQVLYTCTVKHVFKQTV